jgi:hypothetical protein
VLKEGEMKKLFLTILGYILLLSFLTANAQVVDDFLPVNELYATGYFDSNGKHDGDINLTYPNVGWAVFDISSLPAGVLIQSIKFSGYMINSNFPKWSATPMGIVNPLVDPGTDIYNQILTGYNQNTAYIYQDDWSTFTFGWYNYDMGNDAVPDFQAAVNSSQGWFAVGFIVRDFISGNSLIFAGHNGPNPPYLEVTYQAVPVELTSFTADVHGKQITLSWQTATETNNKGFEIQRIVREASFGEDGGQKPEVGDRVGWEDIGFVNGNGTAAEMKSYSFTDNSIYPGTYKYRLKQIDFDGKYKYSKEIEVSVNAPATFALQQNYPNPFNPTTIIQYSIPEDQHVVLNLYNVLGQKVITLVDGLQKAGKHEVNFNAISGSRVLASGVYFYKLHAGNQSQIKKMILQK